MDKYLLPQGFFEGKTFVVTGGGTGLGKAIGHGLLSAGANLVIFSRKIDVLEKTKSELEAATGGKVLAVAGDVRDVANVTSLYEKALERFGSVDGLVNNAAGNFVSPTHRLSANAFSAVIDIVLKGTINCTLEFGKKWIAEKAPSKVVLSIVTTYAETGSAYVVPSACAKAGVVALTKSLAVEWAKFNIRLNAIAPGMFPTPGAMGKVMPDILKKRLNLLKEIPLGRVGDPAELANLSAYLLSDYAAYMSGQILTLDGAETLKGAGQFNYLEDVPVDDWDAIEAASRKGAQ